MNAHIAKDIDHHFNGEPVAKILQVQANVRIGNLSARDEIQEFEIGIKSRTQPVAGCLFRSD